VTAWRRWSRMSCTKTLLQGPSSYSGPGKRIDWSWSTGMAADWWWPARDWRNIPSP